MAEYCARHMPEFLQSNMSYKSGDLPTALRELFISCDQKLLEKDVISEMKTYGLNEAGTEGEEDSR